MTKFMLRLQELLDEHDLTLRKLAKEINVAHQILYAYENEDILPSIKMADKLANYFKCSINYLVALDAYNDKDIFKNIDLSKFYPRYINLLEVNNTSHYYLAKTKILNHSSKTNWKNGMVPKLDTLIKIAEYFNVSIDYLVGKCDNY